MQRAMRLTLLVGCLPAALAVHLRATPANSTAAAASPVHLALQHAARAAASIAAGARAVREGCGGAPAYENAKTKSYADGRKEAYNEEAKKMEAVTFASGHVIEFQCSPGFTTDGSRGGNTIFNATCSEHGYYKPDGVCMKASKCGAVPSIPHAAPTGKVTRGKTEFACNQGYSLDGEAVVNGGMGANRFFELKCVEFSGEYEEFAGECKAYAFVPATATIRIYNKVTEALFVVSCKGTLKKAFGKGETPAGLDSVCSGFGDSSAACAGLVTQIKADFTSQLAARDSHDAGAKKEWYEEKDPERPGIDEHAQAFCSELWQLLEMPSM